ncbi:MAG: hypothetical protein RL238_193 [Actinomycetota bacterium]|jgi:hypothetical protein
MGVFVVGMHRSGTSTLVRMFEAAGFHAGEEADFHPPTEHDPEGHREHIALWGTDEAVLAYIGRSWDDPVGIDWDALTDTQRADVLGAVVAAAPAFTHTEPWVAKDPRLCLTLPLWAHCVPGASAVFVHRNPLEVAESLRARDGWPLAAGIALWEAYVRAALRGLAVLPHAAVDFDALLEQPDAEVQSLLERLHAAGGVAAPSGGSAPPPIRPDRVRHRRTTDETAAHLNPAQRDLLDAVHLRVADHPDADAACRAAAATPVSESAADLLAVLAKQRRDAIALHHRVGDVD